VDDVPVIDDMTVPAAGMWSAAAQRHQRRAAETAFEPVVVASHPQAMADQPRGHRIEDLSQDEAARRGDGHDRRFVIGRTASRQRLQRRTLEIQPLGNARIAPTDNLVDEAAISVQRVEIARAAQQQRIRDRLLQVAVRALDRAVLVRQAGIVAGRLHAVMGARRLVPLGRIPSGVAVEIAEGGRQAIAAMLQRRTSERPQRILQTLSQDHETLAARHDMAVLPTGEGQPKMIEPMIEWRAGDADREIAHVGKIGQPEPTRRVLLPENHVLLGAVQRPPGADAPFQRTPDAGTDLGMAAAGLIEDGDRPQAGGALQRRHHFTVPDFAQRVRAPPATWCFLL
jgi:hypothetical protein